MAEYRIVQGGQVVAGSSGETAWREIAHHAAQYAEEGPLTIQERANGHWRTTAWVNEAEEIAKAGFALVKPCNGPEPAKGE